jgi:hypothetical protein
MSAHIFLPSPFWDSASGSGPEAVVFSSLYVCVCEGAARGGVVGRIKCLLSAAKRDAWGRGESLYISCVRGERQLNLKTHGFCFCACARRRIHFSRESTKKKLWPDAWESSSLFLLFSRAFAPASQLHITARKIILTLREGSQRRERENEIGAFVACIQKEQRKLTVDRGRGNY